MDFLMAEWLSVSAYSMACSNTVAEEWQHLLNMQKNPV